MSEPPRRQRAERNKGENVAEVYAQYQERLQKLIGQERYLEEEQRVEEAKLQILAKERRNKQLQQNISKTKKRVLELQEEGARRESKQSKGNRKSQLTSQSASSKERWTRDPRQTQQEVKEEVRERR